jgi:hypothetical protein
VDRSQQILSAIDELRQIRKEVRLSDSMDSVRKAFDRLREVRRHSVDDFDLQVMIADTQEEIIERGRALRDRTAPRITDSELTALPGSVPAPGNTSLMLTGRPRKLDDDAAEIPPDVPKLDARSWQVAMGLAAVIVVAAFALFFYLIQTARHINFEPDSGVASNGAQKTGGAQMTPVQAVTPAVSITPTLRLYTDLIPGTVSIDEQPEQTLVDGEFNLDNIQAGDHTVRVSGKSGSASFSFTVADDKHAPVAGSLPVSNNAMVVLVSVENGQGRLVTDASGAEVSLDGKPAGSIGAAGLANGSTPTDGLDGLALSDLGNADHDLEVSQARDKQKFVLTYTPAPALTVFVKSDPSTGMLTVITGQDEVSVYIDDTLYRRTTDHGRLRVPLKVGTYRIRIHKDGFIDPPPAKVDVMKAEEASVLFRMQPAPDFASLQVKGAQTGTSVYVDGQLAATIGADGMAKVVNIKSGDHIIELRHDQQVPKQLTRTFTTGATIVLTGNDVMLDKLSADSKSVIPANPGGTPMLPPPVVPVLAPPPEVRNDAETVHKGGGFVPYQTPRVAGHYSFQAHTRIGGLLKHGKLQWYAGYRDKDNYVMYIVDGKHASVREMRAGKIFELGKVPFEANTDEWVQVDVTLKPDAIEARVKTPASGWREMPMVESTGEDFTKDSVGLYVPSNDEVAVANFRFSGH